MRRWVILGIASTIVVAGLTPSIGAAADPSSTAVVAVNTTWPGTNRESQFHAFDGSAASGQTKWGQVEIGGSTTSDDGVVIDLAPPAGQTWHDGYYGGVVGGVGNQPTASIELFYGSTSETVPYGTDLDVQDVGFAADGTVNRMDVVLRMPSQRSISAFFGEFRWNEAIDRTVAVVPSAWTLSWPNAAVGSDPVKAVERLHNVTSTAHHIGRITVTGEMAADFPVLSDGCSNTDLAAGASCDVVVASSPTRPGPVEARLNFPVDSGLERAELDGAGDPGNNGFRYQIGPNPVVRLNAPWQLNGGNLNNRLSFGAVRLAQPDSGVNVAITAPGGAPVTTGAHRVVYDDGAAGYTVNLSFCNNTSGTVTVSTLMMDTAKQVRMADVTWNLHCFDDGETTTGRVLYRGRSDVTGPGAVSAVSVSGPVGARVVNWANPRVADWSRTIVRLVPGVVSGGADSAGYLVTAGHIGGGRLPAMVTGAPYTLLFFTVDTSGNVSAAGRTVITG